MVIEARRELGALRAELGHITADIRTAADSAEQRVAESARIAEATVATRAEGAAAGAVRAINVTASDAARRLEQQAVSAESTTVLQDVIERLQEADARLRESDKRTKDALRHLRAVPEEEANGG